MGLYRVCYRYSFYEHDDDGCAYIIDDEFEDTIRAQSAEDIFDMTNADLSMMVGVNVVECIITEIEEVWYNEGSD